MNNIVRPGLALALILSGTLAACGGESADASPAGDTPVAEAAAPSVQPTGTVIEIDMVTDGEGNYFEPSEIEAKRGDVLRFKLVSGVHNVSFPTDGTPGAEGLPAPSEYLQLPGQTLDIAVDMAAGEYAFQCDPHAALGMVGTLTVTN